MRKILNPSIESLSSTEHLQHSGLASGGPLGGPGCIRPGAVAAGTGGAVGTSGIEADNPPNGPKP